jgi:hypothetical protein
MLERTGLTQNAGALADEPEARPSLHGALFRWQMPATGAVSSGAAASYDPA